MSQYIRTGVWFILSTFLFQSCAVWRSETRIETPDLPEQYSSVPLQQAYDSNPWWLGFDDPALNTLMEETFSENLTIRQAAGRLDQLRALYRGSKSNLFPNIVASGSYQASKFAGYIPSFIGSSAESSGSGEGQSGTPDFFFEGYTVGLNSSYEIDLWGKLSAQRKASHADLLAGEADMKAIVLSVSAQLTSSYYRTIELSQQLELLEKTVSAYEDYVGMVKGRYERGVSPSVELYQAEINLARARSQKTQVEAGFAAAEHALSILLGRYPERSQKRTDGLPSDLPAIRPGLPSELLQRRPDIVAAYNRMRSADARWAEAVTARYPSFSLTGRVSGSSDELADAIDPDNLFWNAIGSLTAPIFMGGALKANADRAEAGFETEVAAYEAVLLNAFREVEDALVRLEKQRQYVAEVESLTASAENLLRVATDRYMRGVSDYLPLVLAQTETLNARRSLIVARRELIDTYIRLSAALGGNWMDGKMTAISAVKDR